MIDARASLRVLLAGLALAVALAPACANAAGLGGGEELYVSLWRIIAALFIAIILIVLTALLVRQRGGKIDLAMFFGRVRLRPREIDVVETRRLSPHADICLVRHHGREYLLLLGAGHGRVLRCSDANPDAQAGEAKR